MTNFIDDAKRMAVEAKQKREAEKAAQAQVEQAKQDLVKEQKEHEENKRHGMI